MSEATPSPWLWADWSAEFGTVENAERRVTLEHNPKHLDASWPVKRTRLDESRRVLRLEEPIENDADAYLIQHAPELADALDEMLDMFGGNMDRADYERFRLLLDPAWEY